MHAHSFCTSDIRPLELVRDVARMVDREDIRGEHLGLQIARPCCFYALSRDWKSFAASV